MSGKSRHALPRCYTGIGSRQTPPRWLTVLESLGEVLARDGWTLRSGAAEGADRAFEQGARRWAGASLEIYLPWAGFNDHPSSRIGAGPAVEALARTLHPAWERLSPAARRLHGRNTCQVLGADLDHPSEFVIAWTADGCESEATRGPSTGGTATAIVLATRRGIPVFNLGRPGRAGDLARDLARRGVTWQDPSEPGIQESLAW